MGVRGLGKHVMLVGGARCAEHCADLNEWPPPLNARREGGRERGGEVFMRWQRKSGKLCSLFKRMVICPSPSPSLSLLAGTESQEGTRRQANGWLPLKTQMGAELVPQK